MRTAAASIDITPPVGLPLAGNVRDDNISRGVHDRLFCNAIILEYEGETVCFLSYDLIGLGYDACNYIKKQVEQKSGIKSSKIIVSSTHTHSGPDVLGIFKDSIDIECMEYLEDITRRVAANVAVLINELEETRISISRSEVFGLSFNRRLFMKEGIMSMNWEGVEPQDVVKESGPIDPELYVISFRNRTGKLKALMVNFALHPAVLVGKDWLYSRDFPDGLDTYVKEKLGSDTIVFFANGTQGNINHINYKDKNQGRGFEEAKRIGNALGQEVIKCLDHEQPLKDKSLKCMQQTITLPHRLIPREDIEKAEKLIEKTGDKIPSLLDGVPDEMYAREIIKLSKSKEKYAETVIHAVRVGDIVIVTLPGEVFVEFGIKIKENSAFKNTLVFGITNDFIGYIPTQKAFKEGGYEIKTAFSSKLDKMAGDILVSEVNQLIEKLMS